MSFSITEFLAQVNKFGLAKSNLFMVRISLPRSLQFLEEKITARELVFLCKTVDLPSFEFQHMPIKNLSVGPMEFRPTSMDYQPISAIFMVDSNFGVMSFFHRWAQAIYNYNADAGNVAVDSQNKLPYELDYKENYAATIDILVYSGNDANKVYSYKLSNAFPLSIQNVTTSWENQSEIMTLPVSFTFDKISVTGSEFGKVSDNSNTGNGILNYISAINSYGQAINQLNRPQSLQDIVNLYTDVSTIFNTL